MQFYHFKIDKTSNFYKNEIKYLFEGKKFEHWYIIITIQFSKTSDLFSPQKTDESEGFKNNGLEVFMKKCEDVKLPEDVYFDYVDPSSGILMNSDNQNVVYNELTGATNFLVNA